MKKTTKVVRCTHAATNFYVSGREYSVYEDTQGTQFIQGKDGLWDKLGKTISRFVALDNSKMVSN